MKLLILTQKVDINDDILGFFHGWIAEFAKHCEKITVICLQKGEYELPENVKVLSLGKEKFEIRNLSLTLHSFGRTPPKALPTERDGAKLEIWKWLYGHIVKLLYCWKFYKYIWQERKNYDTVFVHMNPEYAVLGGILWKLWNKKILLWYVHRAVNLKLRIAEKLADIIFTASKESFCLPSKKLKIISHGIDAGRFKISDLRPRINKRFKIVYVGRISRIKNQELLIRAVDKLVNQYKIRNLQIMLIGSTVTDEDEKYLKYLNDLTEKFNLRDYIEFIGSVRNKEMPAIYNQADLSINLCPTGGADKAVLESCACGVPVIVYNKTFVSIFSEYKDKLILNTDSEEESAEKIIKIIELHPEERREIGKRLRKRVIKNYCLSDVISNILYHYN